MRIVFTVSEQNNGKPLHDIFHGEFNMSNNLIKRVKLYGTLNVNGIHTRVIDHVKTGDVVEVIYGEDVGPFNRDNGINFLFEDEHLAVVEKPAGLVTHPTHHHLDDSLTSRLSDKSLHPVMRLDRETSGLLCIAKNGYIHALMSNINITKKYVAVVYGRYNPPCGTIDKPIKRRDNSVMIREVNDDGYPSTTCYKEIFYDKDNNISLVEFILKTGRCHQIRVHSTFMGHPLVGDGLYGPNSIDNPCDNFPNSLELDNIIGRQALHAYYLKFNHPLTDEVLSYKSQIPDDMLKLFTGKTNLINELFGKL